MVHKSEYQTVKHFDQMMFLKPDPKRCGMFKNIKRIILNDITKDKINEISNKR